MDFYQHEFDSPVGRVYVVSDGKHVRAVDFEGYESRLQRLLVRHYGQYSVRIESQPSDVVARLKDYFAGDLHALDKVPTATNGTDFQQRVWAALRTIPVGTTATYASIADRIGSPNACRAVGLANGSNPIGIIVPCHRVIGTNKSLTGYGGGIERKQWLLEHEGVLLPLSTPRSLRQQPVNSDRSTTQEYNRSTEP